MFETRLKGENGSFQFNNFELPFVRCALGDLCGGKNSSSAEHLFQVRNGYFQ